MNIYVTKNGLQHGPYTPAEVRARLASGHFIDSDLAWPDGATSWLPLSHVLATSQIDPHEEIIVPQRSSALAKASFIISMVGIGAWFVLIVAAAAGNSAGASETSPLMVVVGLSILGGMVANLAGCILGVVTISKPISNKWMAVTGLIANGVELVAVLILMIVGLAMK
jgi:hypothetical protein